MARRYEVSDEQQEAVKPFLGNTPESTGRPPTDNRKLLKGPMGSAYQCATV